MSLAEFLKKERRASPVLMFASIVALGVIAGSFGIVAPQHPEGLLAAAPTQNTSTASSEDGSCKKAYEKCLTDYSHWSERAAHCEKNVWMPCVTKKCVESEAKTGAEQCPKDSDCEMSCTESASGTGGLLSCCEGGPKLNNSCKKKIDGKCTPITAPGQSSGTGGPGSSGSAPTPTKEQLQQDLDALRVDQERLKKEISGWDGQYQACMFDKGTQCDLYKDLSGDAQKVYNSTLTREEGLLDKINSYGDPAPTQAGLEWQGPPPSNMEWQGPPAISGEVKNLVPTSPAGSDWTNADFDKYASYGDPFGGSAGESTFGKPIDWGEGYRGAGLPASTLQEGQDAIIDNYTVRAQDGGFSVYDKTGTELSWVPREEAGQITTGDLIAEARAAEFAEPTVVQEYKPPFAAIDNSVVQQAHPETWASVPSEAAPTIAPETSPTITPEGSPTVVAENGTTGYSEPIGGEQPAETPAAPPPVTGIDENNLPDAGNPYYEMGKSAHNTASVLLESCDPLCDDATLARVDALHKEAAENYRQEASREISSCDPFCTERQLWYANELHKVGNQLSPAESSIPTSPPTSPEVPDWTRDESSSPYTDGNPAKFPTGDDDPGFGCAGNAVHGQTCNDRGTVWAYNSGDKSWNTSYVSDESIKADNLTKVGSHYLGEGSYPLKDGRTVYVGAEPDNPKNGDLLYAKDGNWRYDAKSEEWMRIPDGQVPPGGPTTGSGPDGRCLLIDGPNCKAGRCPFSAKRDRSFVLAGQGRVPAASVEDSEVGLAVVADWIHSCARLRRRSCRRLRPSPRKHPRSSAPRTQINSRSNSSSTNTSCKCINIRCRCSNTTSRCRDLWEGIRTVSATAADTASSAMNHS